MITIENITRKYGDFVAVDSVSFEITKGEIVGLLGHNGAGKTTIMKMLTGFLEPTSGTIRINGRSLDENMRAIQAEIGYLPENCPLYPEMTVIDYLDYSASLRGIDGAERDSLIGRAIEKTNLYEKADQPISTLSRGYRQRTGVAQAILHNPQILILDEPTNGLDPSQIRQMRQLIQEVAQQSTVIVSTHILQEVQAVCDRVIIINDGKKVVDERLADLKSRSCLLVNTDGAASEIVGELEALDGIAGVRVQDGEAGKNRIVLRLNVADGADRDHVAAAVAATVHGNSRPLFGLGYEEKDLESVFSQLSRV